MRNCYITLLVFTTIGPGFSGSEMSEWRVDSCILTCDDANSSAVLDVSCDSVWSAIVHDYCYELLALLSSEISCVFFLRLCPLAAALWRMADELQL